MEQKNVALLELDGFSIFAVAESGCLDFNWFRPEKSAKSKKTFEVVIDKKNDLFKQFVIDVLISKGVTAESLLENVKRLKASTNSTTRIFSKSYQFYDTQTGYYWNLELSSDSIVIRLNSAYSDNKYCNSQIVVDSIEFISSIIHLMGSYEPLVLNEESENYHGCGLVDLDYELSRILHDRQDTWTGEMKRKFVEDYYEDMGLVIQDQSKVEMLLKSGVFSNVNGVNNEQ